MQESYLIVIQGPTSSGKTDLALFLAQKFKTEIISADSRQFYREMNIGTAKPTQDQLKLAKHHFVNSKSIIDDYNASIFEIDGISVIKKLFLKKKIVVLIGGSGLYVDAIINGLNIIPDVDSKIRENLLNDQKKYGLGYLLKRLEQLDPIYYNEVDKNNSRRVIRALEVTLGSGKPYSGFIKEGERSKRNFKVLKIGLNIPKEELHQRINNRCDIMLENNLMKEVKALFPQRHLTALQTIGYKEFFDYLEGKVNFNKAVEQFKQHTRNYAKRQLTWLRRDKEIEWFHPENREEILNYIIEETNNSKI